MTDKEWFDEGVELIKVGRNEEALKAYERAIEINPQFAEAWYAKGVALSELERHEESLKAYEKSNRDKSSVCRSLVRQRCYTWQT